MGSGSDEIYVSRETRRRPTSRSKYQTVTTIFDDASTTVCGTFFGNGSVSAKVEQREAARTM